MHHSELIPANPEQFKKDQDRPLLPKIFQLPDLSKLKPDEQNRRAEFVFPYNHRGNQIFCKIAITRNHDMDNLPKYSSMKYAMPIEIRIEGHAEDPNGKNPFDSLFAFSTYLETGDFPHKEKYADLKSKPFWNISYRMVEPDERGKGYGELALKLIDEVIAKIEKETDLQGEYISIDTALSSLAMLIVDQDWLKQHGLEQLKNGGKRNLKFMPHPADANRVIELLQGSTQELRDIMNSGIKDVKFIRRLD